MSQTLIEKMLPARVLVNAGIYLQSAAHLELTIWQIVMLADGVDQTSSEQFLKTLEIKKITPKLVRQLRQCSTNCHAPLGLRMCALAEKITNGIENRNLVAHGAFYFDDETQSIRVAHYFPRGNKENRQWFEFNEAISERTIKVAIEEIDMLLREAVDIRSELEARSHQPRSRAF
ncbi:hypothetical protein [Sedimentitalea arenosa]|uniref:Uncharacterized protein n=1 Tax=Sedimentitalea arenosa TaxID=2798803 RepID=A0A8J7JEP6_9RHOB|nr:hypothetical protein [Arenibacterium arenosum]MBJ6370039.1 hypothetical protein [Arenibacterium arenosum]